MVIRSGGTVAVDMAVGDAEQIWASAIARHFRGRAA
jgi:hypothetical protein